MRIFDLDQLLKTFQEEVNKISDQAGLEALEQKFFSRKHGLFTEASKAIKDVPNEDKKEYGQKLNEVKTSLESQLGQISQQLKTKSGDEMVEGFDVTAPGVAVEQGGLSILTQVREEIEDIFRSMGWGIWDGEELSNEWQVFDACNFEDDHPAREIMDTFWIDPKEDKDGHRVDSRTRRLPRPHLSGIQNQLMSTFEPPFRFIYPGKCFRYEAVDARHEHDFYQVEGLMVGKDISLAHFKAMTKELLAKLFRRDDVEIRMRAGFFPFVEPGFEIDFRCLICDGKGCSACKGVGWIEIMPGGMVHPNVLRKAGLDTQEWNGFAFAIGTDRIAMLRHKIEHIGLFHRGDLRFEEQF